MSKHHEGQWIGSPWAARGIRVFVIVVPFAASVAFAGTLSAIVPTVARARPTPQWCVCARSPAARLPGRRLDGWAELAFERGHIDVELARGDALELKVQVPVESEHHVWLAFDSLETPSRFVFDAE